MKAAELVKQIMDVRGMSIQTMSEKLGYKTRSGASERLRAKQDMRLDVFKSFLDALDCEIVIRSKLKDKKEWVITSTDDE